MKNAAQRDAENTSKYDRRDTENCDKVLLAIPRSATRLDYKGIELCVSHQGIEQQTKHICGYY